MIQFLHGLAIESVENLRPVEGDESDLVPLLIEQVFVSHALASSRRR
jgi:hypothetical protein